MGIFDYSKTAASNSTVGGRTVTDAMVPSDVNNAFQGMAGEVAEWRDDTGGQLTTTGSANTYVLATNATVPALADGVRLHAVLNASNTGASTLNVDSLGAKAIRKGADEALASGDILAAGHYIFQYDASANSAAGAWLVLNPEGVTAAYVTANSIANVVEDTTPQSGGAHSMNSFQMQEAKGADVASGTALTLGTDGNSFDITGTTTITSIGTLAVGTEVTLQFDGILTLTHHATDLILPSGANITTAAGDIAKFYEYATGDWRCINYTKADGTAVVAPSAGVTVLDRVVTESTWASSVAEETVMTYTVPADTMGTTGIIRATFLGRFRNASISNRNIIIKIKFGGTILYHDTTDNFSASSTSALRVEIDLSSNNSTSSQKMNALISFTGSSTDPDVGDGRIDNNGSAFSVPVRGIASSADTTSNQDLVITMQMSASAANVEITKDMHLVELI